MILVIENVTRRLQGRPLLTESILIGRIVGQRHIVSGAFYPDGTIRASIRDPFDKDDGEITLRTMSRWDCLRGFLTGRITLPVRETERTYTTSEDSTGASQP